VGAAPACYDGAVVGSSTTWPLMTYMRCTLVINLVSKV
jgi:hypothetical protein